MNVVNLSQERGENCQYQQVARNRLATQQILRQDKELSLLMRMKDTETLKKQEITKENEACKKELRKLEKDIKTVKVGIEMINDVTQRNE